jgi:ubiquinone/menaquinone biosynthesis C-methylase UbiE
VPKSKVGRILTRDLPERFGERTQRGITNFSRHIGDAPMAPKTLHDQLIVEQFTRWAKPFSDLPVHSEAGGLARTLAAARLEPGMRVLDVACGPGIVACAMAPHAGYVTGVDLTPAMIGQARERQERLKLANLHWQVADATQLPFPDGAFDLVITRYSFHHMPDPSLTLREMERVCRAGGRLVVIDATPSAGTQAAYDRMETIRDPSHASALTLEQVRELGRQAGLVEDCLDEYRLEAQVSSLADEADMPELARVLGEDIASGQDQTGVGAHRKEDGLWILFPVSIVGWHRT